MRQLSAVFCAIVFTASTAMGAISFVRPTTSTTVPMPAFITSADFNRDGFGDVAISSPSSSEVAIVLGSATGALATGVTYDLGKQLSGIAAGDLDGDNVPDIVVADQRGPGVHVLIGHGDGTFATATFIAIGRGPFAVAVADLDGANNSDIVITDRTDDKVRILLNNGQRPPVFSDGGEYSVGDGPAAVLVADFNADGHGDIVTLNTGGTRVKDLSMLLFDRIASNRPVFHFVANFSAGEGPLSFSSGDFDGDAKRDLAVLNVAGGGTNGTVDVLLGRSNGFFVQGPSLAIPCPVFTNDLTCRARAFAAADFDGDGVLDLAITQADPRAATNQDWLAFFRGSGDAMFVPGPVLDTDPVATLAIDADVTNDGAPDVIVGSERVRSVEAFVNTSKTATGDRIPGQSCDADTQCVTGLCRDTVCCRTTCAEDERCNLPNHLGTCTPQGSNRSNGSRCDRGDQCESTFCVDQVCCIVGTCPTGARCDIPATAGVCSTPADNGQSCDRPEHCHSGFCVDDVCCADTCPDGRCDAPGHEGTCTGTLASGQPCSANAQCSSGICDTQIDICCEQRCGLTQQCAPDGTTCTIRSDTPTPTETGQPTATPQPSCPGDCDGSNAVAVSELVRGVNIALNRLDLASCTAFDSNGDGRVTVNELVAAVAAALHGCG